MFCPQCRAEYRKGFLRCSDCDVPLVDELPPDAEAGGPADLETGHPELVVLRTFPNVVEADLAKSALESVGIDSMVRSDNQGGQSPALGFSRSVELLVRAEDVEAANDMLGLEGLEEDNSEVPDDGEDS
jgi:Putative prokaryotic signal transducing protein